MAVTGYTITNSTFKLGAGFEKGNEYVGYYIEHNASSPKKSTGTGTCSVSTCGSGNNVACTSKQDCEAETS